MDLRRFGLSDAELRQLGYDVRRKSQGEHAGVPRDQLLDLPEQREPKITPPRRPSAARGWLATVGVLVAVGWVASSARRLPTPMSASGPLQEFSSGRAIAQLADVAQQPRPTGSPENERVRDLVLGRLRSLGLEPELQTTTSFERDSAFVTAATLSNVMARLPGTRSTGALLVTAHYDGTPLSPAAGDDGIGVATVLETVRALAAVPPLRNDVIVLFTDGDELGQLGSRAFSEHHPWMADVAVVLSVEARGASGPAFLFEKGPGNGRIVDALAATEPRPAALSLGRSLRDEALESGGDHPLVREGVPGINLTVLGDAAWQHQPRDLRSRVSERTIQHAGRQLLAMARALGDIDLRSELSAPDQVYVSLPWVGLLHYSRTWVLPTTLALVALSALVGLALRGRRATRRGVIVGALAGTGSVGATAAAAGALLHLTAGSHPEFGLLTTAFFEDGTYALAVAALAIACGTSVYAIARTWVRADELVFGAVLPPLLACVWLTFSNPFAAPAMQLPLSLTLLGAALVVGLGPHRARTVWASGTLTVTSALSLVLVVPAVELLASVWTFRAAVGLGSVMGLGVLLLWPLMDRLLAPRAWWTPLAALGVAGAMTAVASPRLRGPEGHPVPTTLLYLADQPLLGEPAPSGARGAHVHSSELRSMAGRWLTVAGPGEEWARSWAGEPVTGSAGAGALLLHDDSLYRVVGTAPVSELAPPRATVIQSAEDGGRRLVEVALEPGLAGEMTGILLAEGSPGAVVGVGDAHWESGGSPVRSVVHWGRQATPELRVRFEIESRAPEIDLTVIEHHLRPREILGTYFFQRPDSLIANVALGSDRAIQRTRLRISLPPTDLPVAR